MEIKLSRNVEQRLVPSIQRYIKENFDAEAGELKASLFLKFCMEEIAPAIYNQAIQDAQGYFQERVADLENVCFAKEGNYWKKEDASAKRKSSLRR